MNLRNQDLLQELDIFILGKQERSFQDLKQEAKVNNHRRLQFILSVVQLELDLPRFHKLVSFHKNNFT